MRGSGFAVGDLAPGYLVVGGFARLDGLDLAHGGVQRGDTYMEFVQLVQDRTDRARFGRRC
jgi:hypothetical protein